MSKHCGILSGNPFQYNMFLSNFWGWSHCIDKLHVCMDNHAFHCDLSKIYKDLSFDGRIVLDIPYKAEHGASIRSMVESANENDVVFVSHDDLLIVKEAVLREHLEMIENGTYDAVFVRAGIGEPIDYINEFIFSTYPDVKAIYSKDQNLVNMTGVTSAYFLTKAARLLSTDRKFGQQVFYPSSRLGAWTIDRRVFFEVLDWALLQMYSQGFRNVLPYRPEDDIIMYDVAEVTRLEKFLSSGMVHCTGSATTRSIVTKKVVWGAGASPVYLRRMFFHTLNSIMYFDFGEYPYMKEFACDVYIKRIKAAMTDAGITEAASEFPYETMSPLFKMRFYRENLELLK